MARSSKARRASGTNTINKDPLVSILIPTYNRREWLPIALNSLVNQSYKNLDIVVVNDAGCDVSDIIESYNDPRIQYHVNEKNLDLAGTRNVAIGHSKGDYICLLDDDDFHLPYTIETRLYWMKKLQAEIVYTRALQDFLEKGQDGKYYLKGKQLYWDCSFDRDLILIQNIAPCCCQLFSRKAWNAANNYLFDTKLNAGEDWDFWVNLSRNYDFKELKILDVECTFRTDNSQMTGSRPGYTTDLPYMYGKWRPFASPEKRDWVIAAQNDALKRRGLKPEEYGL